MICRFLHIKGLPSRGCLPRFSFSQMRRPHSGNTQRQLLSKRCFALEFASPDWRQLHGSPRCLLWTASFDHLPIILGNFGSLLSLLKRPFWEAFRASQPAELAEVVRKKERVCMYLWEIDWKQLKEQASRMLGEEQRGAYIRGVLPRDRWLLGRSKDAVALRQLSVNWGKNINWKSADVCSDVRLLKPAFNLCNLNLMTCGAQFPMAAFTEERGKVIFLSFIFPLFHLVWKKEQLDSQLSKIPTLSLNYQDLVGLIWG